MLLDARRLFSVLKVIGTIYIYIYIKLKWSNVFKCVSMSMPCRVVCHSCVVFCILYRSNFLLVVPTRTVVYYTGGIGFLHSTVRVGSYE